MVQPKPTVAVLSFSHIERDARVLRQIRCLAEHHNVEVVGYGKLGKNLPESVRMHALPQAEAFLMRNLKALPKLLLGRVLPDLGYERWYWDRPDYSAAYATLVEIAPDAIAANDWDALPAAARAAKRCHARLVLDLHEYSPRQFDNRRAWMALISPMITHTLRKHGGSVSRFLTVNRSIADRYQREFGFTATVVMNAPDARDAPPFHATNPTHIHLVHHGVATPDRKLETMIEAVAAADQRYVLHFMLMDGNRRYLARLRRLAQTLTPGRVFFEPSVTPDQIVPTIARYDMGLYILPPLHYNSHVALPNKFFDFVSAGLATCTGPSPEMARLSREYGFGVVSETFSPGDAASLLCGLRSNDIDAMKRHAIAAREQLCARVELQKLERVFADLLGA